MSYRFLILFILFFFILSINAQNEQQSLWNHTWFINHIHSNAYPKKLLSPKEKLSWEKLFYISLISYEYFPDSLEFVHLKDRLKSTFFLPAEKLNKENHFQFIQKIQEIIYSKLENNQYQHENYDQHQSKLIELLKSGKYNCVSSSLLYLITLQYFQIHSYGVLEDNHSYIAFYYDSILFSVETTTGSVIQSLENKKNHVKLLEPLDYIAKIMPSGNPEKEENQYFYPYIELKSRISLTNENAQTNCFTAYLSLFHKLLDSKKTEEIDSFLVSIDPYFHFIRNHFSSSTELNDKLKIFTQYKQYFLELKAREQGDLCNWVQAVSIYQSITENPSFIESPEFYNNYAICYLNWGVETKNKEYLKKALKLCKDESILDKCKKNICLIDFEYYLQKGELHKAEEILKECFQENSPEYKQLQLILNNSH